MTQRFLHTIFKCLVPCDHCPGKIEVEAEGHYYDGNFVVDSVRNLHTGQDIVVSDAQRSVIEVSGDAKFPEVYQENIRHLQEARQDCVEVE
jgi:hypothetical protein